MKKLLRYYLFLLFFISTHFVQSQNLTISTTGQTGTSGTNWSIAGNTLTATGTADINASVINNHLATNVLTVSAGSVTFNANISSTTANSLSILSNTFITNSSATTITTNGGSILFASNVDDATDGESTTNGYIQLRYGITINTSGGNITFGGGNTSGSNYSLGSSDQAYTEGVRFDTSIALNSGGGNITLRGKSYAMDVQSAWGASGVGFYFFSGTTGTINSGTGTITIDGYSQTSTSSYASGIYCMHNMTITSANTTANAIRLIGKATGSSGDAYGIETENTFSVIATGIGGGITVSSSIQMADTFDAVFRGEANILAKSGAIQLLGKQDGGVANGRWYTGSNFYLGSKAGSTVTSSSSNITIQYDKFNFAGTRNIATSGTLKLQPASASFGMSVYTSWFSWNQNSQTMSGLTIGKSDNTASSVVLDSPLSVAGPITAYGATIYLYNNLTTTNNGAVSFYSDNAIVFDALRTVTAAGAFNYIPQGTSFVAAVTYPIINLTLSSAGLLIGNTTNTANITFSSATTTAGPITVYGGAINLIANLSSTATNADILLKAATNINQAAATTVTTTGGVVNFWADSDDNSTGYVQLLANAAINSNGGNINLGGGSSLATDFAFGTAAESCPEALPYTQYISGVHMRSGSNLNSNGGNISIRGTNANISNFAMSFGVSLRGSTINSGIGKIAINGVARGSSSANAQGVSNWGLLTLRSSNTTSDAISIIGDASATVNSLSSLGINLSTLIEATGAGGGISISGKSGTETGGYASVNVNGDILAVSGPITLSGENSTGVQNNINFTGATVIGKKALTNVLASTSNVILEGNVIVVPAAVSVDCSGAFTVRSFGDSFASALSWPITYITLASSISGLTIGKTTNSANVTFANATTIAGPITAYGGTITLNANLTTTNNGDISLYTDNALSGLTTTARTITAAGSFNYIPRNDFFSAPVTYPITNLNLTSSGLLIGKSTNTAAITFANATSITGPITAYGGTITLNANLTTTINGAISLYSDNPLGLNAARTLKAEGAFKYIPRTTTFSADVIYPITNLTATSTGLTIGNTTNTKNITINQDVTGGAGIELYGANVNINSNLKTTNSGAMYLKGITTIAAGKYIESNGAFTHDGNMTFKSNATGTAAFGTLGGTFTTVSGTSTVERYIPAKRAFRFLSPSVTTSTSIRQNWQENGGTTAGLGTHITGLSGITNGFDATTTDNPSLFTINHSTGSWEAVTNTNSNRLSAGTAYRLMVRGDRLTDLGNNTATASVTTLRATGDLKTGSHSPTLNQAAAGYSFVGNPYQAPVNIKEVLANSTNMNSGVVYYWDPTLNDRGAYVTRTLSSVSTNVPISDFTEILQPGQAVFVKNAATGTPNMTFNESNKSITSGAAGVFRVNTTTNDYGLLRVNLKANANNQWTTIEGALAVFNPMYSWEVTQEDANKFSNLDEEVSFMQNNTSLAIACQTNPSATNELPIRLNNTRHTNYQWQFELGNYSGATPYLFDTQNNTYTQIENNTIVPFTVNGQELTRFKIVFQNGTLSTTDFSNQIVLYPNPGAPGATSFNIEGITEAQVTLFTFLGQNIPVKTATNGKGIEVISKTSLSKGVYLVSITKEGKTSHVKWIVE